MKWKIWILVFAMGCSSHLENLRENLKSSKTLSDCTVEVVRGSWFGPEYTIIRCPSSILRYDDRYGRNGINSIIMIAP